MNKTNVKFLKYFVVVILMFLIVLLSIASNATVCNAVAVGAPNVGSGEIIFSILNLVAEGGLLWFFGKKVLPTV